jgi:hypothetical protein
MLLISRGKYITTATSKQAVSAITTKTFNT